MSLDLLRILPQMQELGRLASRQAEQTAALLPEAEKSFQSVAQLMRKHPDRILAEIEAMGTQWRGAIPSDEVLDLVLPPPSPPAVLNVIGADGSQIYLDRHSVFLYYLINIGSIWFQYGSGEQPQTSSQPWVYFDEHDLYDSQGRLVSPAQIHSKRDIAELAELSRLAQACSENPILALLDNTLTPSIGFRERLEEAKAERTIIKPYLDQFQQLQATQSALAGFIDRPRSTDLLALFSLIGWEQPYNRFRGLADRDLFTRKLPIYHRSALFRQRSPQTAALDAVNQAIYFFYFNSGEKGQIVRIEVPEWVADHTHLIDIVHAGVVRECQGTIGYPYTLMRAHELATVSDIEHQALDQWITSTLLDHGLRPSLTMKATSKRWLGRPRKHTLSRSSS